MSIAFLCPGQGSQSPGLLHQLPEHSEIAKTLSEASEILGEDILKFDSQAALESTVAVQLTAVVASVAVGRALLSLGVEPDAAAGLSVGAFSAAILCGAGKLSDLLPVVRLRACLMEQAYPKGYGMAAVVGLSRREVDALIAQVNSDSNPVYLANLNARTQFVISGLNAALHDVLELAKTAGARKAETMTVPVPSHCPLLAPVAAQLEQALKALPLKNTVRTYVSNCRARGTTNAEVIRHDLAFNVMSPVFWDDSTALLFESGARLFIELPPGSTLTRLASSAFPEARSVACSENRLDNLVALASRGV